MSAVDWPAIHALLENARKALERSGSRGPDEVNAILQSRARALAGRPKQGAAEAAIEVIEFQVAQERYAIESAYVREVYPLKNLTPLPGTPPFVLGIVNIRGQIVSVLDIKKFFDLPDRGLSDLDKVVVIGNSAMTFGLLADLVVGMRRVTPSELQAALPTLTGIREEYLKGVTRDRTAVLAAEKLLADAKIVVREDAQL